ncbi:hypothetical protein ACQ4PT_019462 [Festuca glaucescens]
MAGGNGEKKRKRKRGRRMKRKPGGSPSSSASSDDASPPPVEEERHGGLEVSGGLPDYEFGWHNSLFVGTKGNVDILGSVRNQLLKTCFLCAILYAAEQDIRRWLAIEEPDRQPDIYFDYDTYVTQYETEIEALIGQVQSSFYRTREDRPKTALKIFLRDGVMAYSKSKEWPGGKIIKISDYQFHKDMIFEDFENIIASGGSVIGGFPVGPEFKELGPDEIYEFSPVGVVRKSIGAHMVQFIGTGTDVGREFLVFLNSKKRFGKNGIGKVYFDQIYSGVYTLECRAPPPPPPLPSDDPGLVVAGPDDNDDTLGSSGAAPDGDNKSSFSGAPDGNEAPSSTAPTKSLSQVGKYNRYDDDPISSCAIKIDGWVPSKPALLVEDIQTRTCAPIVWIEKMLKQFKANLPSRFLFCVAAERKSCDIYGPWKKKSLDETSTVTCWFVSSTKMNDLHFTNVLLKIHDKFSKNQHQRKHKQPISASGPSKSSGTMNTTGPFPSLASSASSTITISMQLMNHNASISSPLVVCGADATGTKESPTDQIVDMYHFLENDWLGNKVDLFFSRDDSAGLTSRETYSAGASTKKLACFHFSSDGKLLATGGHNMKAICHKDSATLYANRSVCKLLMSDGEGALSDALRCRMLRPACAKACYRQALMLLKQPQEYKQACDTLLDAQKLDPGNADIKSELRKARELMKNPPVEGAY